MAASFEREAPGFHIAVTGSGGLIGAALIRHLMPDRDHRITRLVRHPAGPGEVSWDPLAGQLDPAALEGIDAVIHLAGENVGARWTAARKRRIRESRVSGTKLLAETIARLRRPPGVLISASAVGIYGNRGDETLTEASGVGDPDQRFSELGVPGMGGGCRPGARGRDSSSPSPLRSRPEPIRRSPEKDAAPLPARARRADRVGHAVAELDLDRRCGRSDPSRASRPSGCGGR